MMMSQEPRAVYARKLSRSNHNFLHSDQCQTRAENLIEYMIERKEKFRKNQELNGDWSKQRKKNKNPKDKDDEMVTLQQLVDLMRRSESKCAITKLTGAWCTSSSTHPFKLTVDHIVPISKGGSLAVSNLQITYYCINQLKGHYHNSHLINFVNGYKEANKNTIL